MCNKCKGEGYYFPNKGSDVVIKCDCTEGKAMKFKVELIVEVKDFAIPPGKSKSMENGMQKEQVIFQLQDALKSMNPEIHNVYKQRG